MRVDIFIIRLILSVGFAILLSRFFHFLKGSPLMVVGLAMFMMTMAYVFEYLRRR